MWKFPDYYSQLENKPFTFVVAARVRYLKRIYNRLRPEIKIKSATLFKYLYTVIELILGPFFILLSAAIEHMVPRILQSQTFYKTVDKVSRLLGVFKEASRSYFQKFYDLVLYRPISPSTILTIFLVISVLLTLPGIEKNFYLRTFCVLFITFFMAFLLTQIIVSEYPTCWPFIKQIPLLNWLFIKQIPLLNWPFIKQTLTSMWRWGVSKTSYIEPNIHNTLYLNRFLHAPMLETVWTIVPGIILIFIAMPSFALLYALDESFDPGQTIKVIGKQWYWRYEYLDNDYKMRAFDSYMLPIKELSLGAPRLLM